jgi:hypothetical protein
MTVEPSTHNTQPIYSKYEKVVTSAKTNFNKHNHMTIFCLYTIHIIKIWYNLAVNSMVVKCFCCVLCPKVCLWKGQLSFTQTHCTFSLMNSISDSVHKSLLQF